jgi:hypothetical protein
MQYFSVGCVVLQNALKVLTRIQSVIAIARSVHSTIYRIVTERVVNVKSGFTEQRKKQRLATVLVSTL